MNANVERLVDDLRCAVADGSWGGNETAALNTWLRVEVIPWAMTEIRQLELPQSAGHLLKDINVLDRELLGSTGTAAVVIADQLETTVRRIVAMVTDDSSEPGSADSE